MSVKDLMVITLVRKLYIKDDEENDVQAVENHEDPKQPPCSGTRKEQGEAASRMVKQKPQFLPYTAVLRHQE